MVSSLSLLSRSPFHFRRSGHYRPRFRIKNIRLLEGILGARIAAQNLTFSPGTGGITR
jgi:hypothetical protein